MANDHTFTARVRIPHRMWDTYGRVLGDRDRSADLLDHVRTVITEHGNDHDRAELAAAEEELATRRSRKGGRPPGSGRNTAVPADALAQLLTDQAVPVAHRALWSLLWDGDVYLDELLSIDVRDVDFEGRVIKVDYPTRAKEPFTVRLGERSAALLVAAIGGAEDGPALRIGDRPISREAAIRQARKAGYSIHGFRLGGQVARGETPTGTPEDEEH
ncbi:hypothetical protein ABZX65_26510 [Streptomyces sp. NPDC003300]|uniref:hypothetical protein n=1 Tax=unclassified Streptomyces TaxID=2593676 RepID=UPI0033BF63F8